MNRWIKRIGITAAVCIGAGLICFVSGVFAGARSGVFITRHGVELEGGTYSDERYDIAKLKDIDIDVQNAKVEIKPSQDDTFGYSVLYEDYHNEPEVSVTNEKLQIRENINGGYWVIDFAIAALFHHKENVVTLYVPEKAVLENVTVSAANGKIAVQAPFTTQNLTIQANNGKIDLLQITAEKKTLVTADNGKITADGSFKGESRFESNNGKVELAGAWEGTMTCKAANGKVQVTAPQPESAYRVEATVDNGSIYVNDSKVHGSYFNQNDKAQNSLYVSTNNGAVQLDFADR